MVHSTQQRCSLIEPGHLFWSKNLTPPINITGFRQQDGMHNDRSYIKRAQVVNYAFVAQGKRLSGVEERRQAVICTSDHGGIQSLPEGDDKEHTRDSLNLPETTQMQM